MCGHLDKSLSTVIATVDKSTCSAMRMVNVLTIYCNTKNVDGYQREAI